MNLEQLVGQAWDTLHGDGTPLEGCMLSEADAEAEVLRRFPRRPYCLVRDWSLIDLECPPEALAVIERSGRRPTVILAHRVVLDSALRCPPGSWIRSTFEVSRDDAGFFVSRNTVYVLLGKGTRRSAPLSVVLSIH
ncbi:DUF6957 family protein [Pseudomonas sp. NY15435]|uniref:DUF6957 family protein n=1 Tax=Pseudomonas sp. NY15435 TaxID=3400358 RepID=UPI003A836B5C